MVSGNGVGGGGWGAVLSFVFVFFILKGFFIIDPKFCTWKIKSLAWKKSFLCAWKFTANTWKLKKMSTWKTQTVREISWISIREKRLPCVKKMKKSPKKRFTHTFYFHVGKKNTACDCSSLFSLRPCDLRPFHFWASSLSFSLWLCMRILQQ